MRPPGPRWAVLIFPFLALVFGWEAFRPGYVFLPTAVETLPPWDGGGPIARPSNPLMLDGLTLTLPARAYNHEMLRQGALPFWNPRIFCGYPHLAMIQNNALYPLSAPFDLVDPVTSIGYAACLHLALAGLLMFLFLRRAGLGRPAALVGGVVFELNGLFLVRLSAPSYLYSGTWLPLLLLGGRGVLEGSRARWALPAGVALTVLGGHPQIAVMALALTAADVAGHALARGGAGGRRLPVFVVLALAGLGLAAYELVPFLELLAHSARDVLPLAAYRRASVPLAAVLQALVPDVFGHPVDGTYWFDRLAPLLDGVAPGDRTWALNYTGENLFTGVAPLVLAAAALWRARDRREVAFWGLAALASLAVFFGTPLLDLAWALLPGFGYSRPDRILFVYMAALSVLAAHGVESTTVVEAVDRPRPSLATRAVAFLLIALLAWPALSGVWRPESRSGLAQWARSAASLWMADRARLAPEVVAAVLVLSAALVLVFAPRRIGPWPRVAVWVALVAVPSLWFGWRFNPAQPAPRLGRTPTEVLLAQGSGGRIARILAREPLFFPPNLPQLLGVDDVHGASAAGLDGYVRLLRAADPAAVMLDKYFFAFRDPRVASTPLLPLLGVEFVAADVALPWPATPVGSGRVTIFRVPSSRPRFYVVGQAETYDDVARARARLLSPDFDPARSALVPAGAAVPFAKGALPTTSSAAIRRHGPHEIEIDVETAGGLLVSSETAYPGWESEVDGRPAQTLLVNTAFRGVAVPPGHHRIRQRFVPRSFVAGLALTVLTLAVVGWRMGREMRGRAR